MAERLVGFNPQNVGGERPYTQTVESLRDDKVREIHRNLNFIAGVTAVHGVAPQQIAANTGLALNSEFAYFGLPPLPIVLPYVPGHPIYGARNQRVLRDVYSPEEQRQIVLSEDLGNALLHTEFGPAGYQRHLDNVRRNVSQVDAALEDFSKHSSVATTLDGKDIVHLTPGGRILEINASSNSSMAKSNTNTDAYEVFPVTFDGLVKYIERNNQFFQYEGQLLTDVGRIAGDLRQHLRGIILPDIQTLGEESWFEGDFPEAIITPPWNEKLIPPDVRIDEVSGRITVVSQSGEVDTVRGYRPDKGVIHLNVSGNDMGAQSAKSFVHSAQDDGYVVAVPPWLKEAWVREEVGGDFEQRMRDVLGASPNILFAKDAKGENLCKAFFMRLGMGSYAYAQLARVPIIFLGFETLDNPEMKGNSAVIERHKLGIRYTGQPNIMRDVQELAPNLDDFNRKVYEEYGIPEGTEGMPAVGRIILLDQLKRRSE